MQFKSFTILKSLVQKENWKQEHRKQQDRRNVGLGHYKEHYNQCNERQLQSMYVAFTTRTVTHSQRKGIVLFDSTSWCTKPIAFIKGESCACKSHSHIRNLISSINACMLCTHVHAYRHVHWLHLNLSLHRRYCLFHSNDRLNVNTTPSVIAFYSSGFFPPMAETL